MWCSNSAKNNGAMTLMQTLGLKTHISHSKCGEANVCKLMKRNTCWLEDSESSEARHTEACPVPFSPKSTSCPKCIKGTLGTNNGYVHVQCSAPALGSLVTIAEYKFEVMTAFKHADGTSVWADYKCSDNASSPCSCLIPMAKLGRHPYGLKAGSALKTRVTATPTYGPVVTTATDEICGPVLLDMPITPM